METKNAEEFRVCEYCKTLLHRREQAIELQTVQPIIAQFYDRLREYIQEGSILRYGTDSTLEYLHRPLVWNLIYIILRPELWICIHYLWIRIQLIFSMRVRIQLLF